MYVLPPLEFFLAPLGVTWPPLRTHVLTLSVKIPHDNLDRQSGLRFQMRKPRFQEAKGTSSISPPGIKGGYLPRVP